MMRAFAVTLAAVAALGVSGTGIAQQKKLPHLSSAAIPQPHATTPVEVRATEQVDFEAAEGFVLGFIDGQSGWSVFDASAVEPQIADVNPMSGSQHLRISNDPAAGQGSYVGTFSPVVTDTVGDVSIVEVDVSISAANGADYFVNPQSPTQSLTTARVQFEYQGNIFVSDDVGSGFEMVDTGVAWNIGTATTLVITVDPGANTITYTYGGTPIYTGVVAAGTLVEQVVLFSDNWNDGDVGDFDDLMINRGDVPVEIQYFAVE